MQKSFSKKFRAWGQISTLQTEKRQTEKKVKFPHAPLQVFFFFFLRAKLRLKRYHGDFNLKACFPPAFPSVLGKMFDHQPLESVQE
jgi:hypothetical protein